MWYDQYSRPLFSLVQQKAICQSDNADFLHAVTPRR